MDSYRSYCSAPSAPSSETVISSGEPAVFRLRRRDVVFGARGGSRGSLLFDGEGDPATGPTDLAIGRSLVTQPSRHPFSRLPPPLPLQFKQKGLEMEVEIGPTTSAWSVVLPEVSRDSGARGGCRRDGRVVRELFQEPFSGMEVHI